MGLQQVGRYQIKGELGKGGMGAVYRGYDPRFDRDVAIKILPREYLHDDTLYQRFEREARTVARLEHPAIVPVYDFGEQDGVPYLVMRYMSGGSLKERIQSGPLSLEETVTILARIGTGLDRAHSLGIIHRDVKPANVLFDDMDNAHLADFGIVKLSEATMQLTGAGMVGTPAYMAPEMADKGSTTPLIDIYAMGVILFEMLAGRQPYESDTPMGLLMAHISKPIPDISLYRPDLSPYIQGILEGALAKNPAERYQSAREFVDDLQSVLQDDADDSSLETWSPAPRDQPPVEQGDFERDALTEPLPEPTAPPPPQAREDYNTLPMQEQAVDPTPRSLPTHPDTSHPQEQRSSGIPTAVWVAGAVLIGIVVVAALIVGGLFLTGRLGDTGTADTGSEPSSSGSAEAGSDDGGGSPEEEADEQPVEEEAVEEEAEVAPVIETGEVHIMGRFGSTGVESFEAAMEPFEQETGIDVIYEDSSDFETEIYVRVEGGDPPDIAAFPQPGLMADFAAEGHLVDISPFLPPGELLDTYTQSWLDMATVDGTLYGVWYRTYVKSLVWYPVPEFEQAGYEIPTTWNELLALSEEIIASGSTPWCIGMESSSATGWVATDWLEDIMLRTQPPDVYDAWVAGDLPFDSPEVRNAARTMADIWLNDNMVLGGRDAVLNMSFMDAPLPMFDQPPSCWLHRQASFIRAFFPDGAEVGRDVDFFFLPPIDEQYGSPVLTAGDVMAMFAANDRSEVRMVMEYLATPQSKKAWIEAGGFTSPNYDTPLAWYPGEIERGSAQILANADTVRFDASDLMPPEVGAGAFWQEITAWIAGAKTLDEALTSIDRAWPSE